MAEPGRATRERQGEAAHREAAQRPLGAGGLVRSFVVGFDETIAEAARRALSAGETRIRARLHGPIAPALVTIAALTGLGFAEGGLLPRTWRLASVAFLALAAAALVSGRAFVLRRTELVALAAFFALAGWTVVSAEWSERPAASLLQGERVLVYAAALTLVLLVDAGPPVRILAAALASAAIVSAYGLARYVIAPPPLDVYEGRLLYQPLGYANALGIVAAIGIVLALGLALVVDRTRARAAVLAPVLVLAPALALTSSRGAVVALAAGLAVVVAVMRPRAGAALAAAAVAATVALALLHVPLARLAGENRPHYWRVALEDAHDHRALGSGAGTYGDYWLQHRPVLTFTRTAHSLYLQALAELGPVGLALVILALALPFVALRRRRDPLAATAAGAYVAYLVHTGVDWDWELPGVTLVGLACGAALLLTARGRTSHVVSTRTRMLLAGAAIALAVLELVRLARGPSTPFGV